MAIAISPETEARLREKADREGQDVGCIADALLTAALEWEELDREAAIAGIQRGLEASAAGRVIPASEVLAKTRAIVNGAK